MNSEKPRFRRPFFTRTVLPAKYVLVCLLVLAGVVVYLVGVDWEIEEFLHRVRDLGPVPFFLALAFLPSVGFPTTPFFLLAGAAFGVWISILGSLLAQGFNLAFSYWLSRRYLRDFLERLIARTRYRIPQVKREHHLKVTLLIKLTPGPPNFLKTYIMGLAGIPFGIFFLVSLPTSVGYGIGIIVVGDSLFDGKTGQAILGAGILVAVGVGVKLLRDTLLRRRRERAARGGAGEEPELP